MEKTTVFNLIILDESGSMAYLNKQTIAGCNETLNMIRSLEKKHGDTQRNLVSIYLFQSNPEMPSRFVVKNKPIADVKDMTKKVYRPWGGTPLLDAVGMTLIDLMAVAETHEDATGTVTIITDGMENSSTEFSYSQVQALISQLKEKGWTVNLIGANIDVEKVSKSMNISNAMSFEATPDGTAEMFNDFKRCYEAHEENRIAEEAECYSREEKLKARKRRMTDMFNF